MLQKCCNTHFLHGPAPSAWLVAGRQGPRAQGPGAQGPTSVSAQGPPSVLDQPACASSWSELQKTGYELTGSEVGTWESRGAVLVVVEVNTVTESCRGAW